MLVILHYLIKVYLVRVYLFKNLYMLRLKSLNFINGLKSNYNLSIPTNILYILNTFKQCTFLNTFLFIT